MSKNKPDKELNRLRHELDNEREKNQEARRQLKLKDNELDTAEKLENKIKGQTFEVEIEILRKELASSKETVRILKAHDKETYEKSSQEFFRIMSSYQDVLRAFQEKHPVTAGAFGENDPATALAGDEVDDDGDLESRDDNQELAVLQINNSMQRMMMRDLKESNKEDAEEHEKEIKAISQELENLKENLANTTKSYDDLLETHNLVSKKYDDLVEATKERDSVPTGSDHEQLLENHNGLTRDYAARIQEIDDLTLLHHEELDLYVEYLLNSEEKIYDLTRQLQTVTLEAGQKTEAYESVKSELNALKLSNAESAARYQEWRASLLRMVNGAPGLATQHETKKSGTDL